MSDAVSPGTCTVCLKRRELKRWGPWTLCVACVESNERERCVRLVRHVLAPYPVLRDELVKRVRGEEGGEVT